MKDILNKLNIALGSLRDKKPAVVVIVLVVLALGYYAAQKGYISEDLLNVHFITEQVEKFFPKEATKVVVDTLAQPISDTLIK